MPLTMKAPMAAAIIFITSTGHAQVSAPRVPEGFVLQPEGELKGARVESVYIRTVSSFGPYTAFAIRPAILGAKYEWFYIRNDNSVKGMERGAMVGLLMGAAQASRWGRRTAAVDLEYHTVGDRKEIVSAGLGMRDDE